MRISDWSADGFAADLHLRLDDRHDAGFLAQRRITGQRMRVGLDAIVTRNAIADRDDGAPLREARPGFAILHEPFAQAVERSGESRVGTDWVGTGRSRWYPFIYHNTITTRKSKS